MSGKTTATGEYAGKVVSSTEFRFDCGFTMPLGQIEDVAGKKLRLGDRVALQVSALVVGHEHEFYCKGCGVCLK